ncbi:hypothetical protein [Haladaptatus sp. CMAA 1911]|uniref:hypothetical protein n=1 Tax=unclassified Haladaptatus TaxID=2622732 RepID=UPI003754ED53
MRRRAFLTAIAGVSTAGCSSKFMRTKNRSEDVRDISVTGIVVKNENDSSSRFNVSLVREGEHVYQGQLRLESGDEAAINPNWKESAHSFAATGMSKRFNNYGIVAIDSKGDPEQRYQIRFTIEPSGDVRGGAFTRNDS